MVFSMMCLVAVIDFGKQTWNLWVWGMTPQNMSCKMCNYLNMNQRYFTTEVAIFCVSDVNYMHCLETLHVNLCQTRSSIPRKHPEGDTDGSDPLAASPGPLPVVLKLLVKCDTR